MTMTVTVTVTVTEICGIVILALSVLSVLLSQRQQIP